MDDKLRDLTPVEVTFAPGERPTDAKLEGMMNQVQNGLKYLEGTVGDAFGESLQKENLWLSNIARDIGDRDLLNPLMMPDIFLTSYVQTLELGENEHELDLIPVGSGASIISSSTDSAIAPSQFKTTVIELEDDGDWTILPGKLEGTILKNSRKLVTHSPSSGGNITFAEVTSGRGGAYVSARHNVMPAVAQAESGGTFCGATLNDALNNIYTFTLPLDLKTTNELYETVDSSLSNTKASVGTGQQLKLPEYMFDVAGLDMGSNDPTSGQAKYFPENIIRIYDWQEKKVVDGLLSIQASSVPANRKIEIVCQFRADISINTTSGEYMVITSGVQLSNMIGALQREVFNHTHSGDDMLRAVDHGKLMGLRTGSTSVSRSENYGPSNIHNNDHSMYFHRDGYTDTDIGSGANVIRGDVVVGNTDLGLDTEHEHDNLNADSHSIYFGNFGSTSGSIYFDKVREHIIPSGFNTIPASFSDTALVIRGSEDDATSLIKTTYIDGNLRVGSDVVLGTLDTDNVVITGNLKTKDMAVTPTDIIFNELTINATDLINTSSNAHFNRVLIADGTEAAPGLTFETDEDLGIYRVGEDDIAIVTNGTDAIRANNTYCSSHRDHRFEDGLEAVPGISFNADTTTGFYRTGLGSIAMASSGVEHSRFDADGLLYTTATAARYSDLAERYESDTVLEAGDVVKLGGSKEITLTEEAGDTEVLGVISTDPALMMNSAAGPDTTHPYVAMVGRVPCKVKGPVNKFERVIASDIAGVAMRISGNEELGGMIIGRALVEKTTEAEELIEVVVGKF